MNNDIGMVEQRKKDKRRSIRKGSPDNFNLSGDDLVASNSSRRNRPRRGFGSGLENTGL